MRESRLVDLSTYLFKLAADPKVRERLQATGEDSPEALFKAILSGGFGAVREIGEDVYTLASRSGLVERGAMAAASKLAGTPHAGSALGDLIDLGKALWQDHKREEQVRVAQAFTKAADKMNNRRPR